MPVHDPLEPLDVSITCGALYGDSSADALEARARAFIDRKKTAQILQPVELDGDGMERNVQCVCMKAPRRFLARRQRGEHNLPRLRPCIRAAEPLWLVNGQGEIADFHRAPESASIFASHLDVDRIDACAIAQLGLGGFKERLERHGLSAVRVSSAATVEMQSAAGRVFPRAVPSNPIPSLPA